MYDHTSIPVNDRFFVGKQGISDMELKVLPVFTQQPDDNFQNTKNKTG